MTKTLMSGVAALAVLMTAPTIFAQDSKAETKQAVQTAEEAMEETTDAAEYAMDDAEHMAEDATKEAAEMAEDAEDMAHDATDAMEEVTEDSAETMEDSMDTDMDVDVEMGEPVACPEGTEAQADGSCMITGDWSPED
ncbi:MAG: hypothetical protein AAF926_05730 [Pseudomonadota bacterium]